MPAELISPGAIEPSSINGTEAFSPRTEKIAQALELATQAHDGQVRAEGLPYVTHCIAVARILECWGIEDENFISAALLHDSVEDGNVSLSDIEESFGKDVAELVDGVSKFRSETGETDDRETLKKVLIKSYIDPRVAVLKLADRLHNMRTLEPMPEQSRIAKSRETLDVYTGLAESLGMWAVKIELEDLAFRYSQPETHQKIEFQIESDPRLKPLFVEHWKSYLERIMTDEEFVGRVEVRRNGKFNLVEKRRKAALQGKSLPGSFSQINDLVSFRVILPTSGDCYRFVGALHSEIGEHVDYDRYDEFIGPNKRTNGYSALQTTLNLPQGATEIAIMTEEMEEFNHWGVVSLMRRGERDLSDYVLKLIFTPKHEVRFLPKAATGIDFAYSLSESLGAQSVSLLVDGDPMELSTVIANATTVEVIRADEVRSAPDPEVLNYCLPGTKQIIEQQLLRAEGDRLAKIGKAMLEHALVDRGLLDLGDLGERGLKIAYRFGSQTLQELYVKVGGGFLSVPDVSKRLDDEGITKEELGWTTIQVSGTDERGILKDLTLWVWKKGGNIINTVIPKRGKMYELRLVVEGMESEGDDWLRSQLTSDGRFKEWKVV